jgi:hypothetical protein
VIYINGDCLVTNGTDVLREIDVLVNTVGGFRTEFDGTQDYDLALRVSEHTNRVHHIPRILYRWRNIAGSSPHEHLKTRTQLPLSLDDIHG